MAEKQKAIFLLDSGAHFSVLPFSPGPRSNDKSYHSGQIWLAPRALVYLACSWRDLLFCHFFPIVPETPVSLLGQDLVSQLKLKFSSPQAAISATHSFRNKEDSTMWTDEMSVG
jgi:hypothetical protein